MNVISSNTISLYLKRDRGKRYLLFKVTHNIKIVRNDCEMTWKQIVQQDFKIFTPLEYRVSHSKEGKVILLCWGHRFWFFPIFWVLHVHEIDSFMTNSSVFIFLMLRALYGWISENLLFLNEFWLFLTFSSLLQVIKSNKPSNTCIFT